MKPFNDDLEQVFVRHSECHVLPVLTSDSVKDNVTEIAKIMSRESGNVDHDLKTHQI